MARDITSLISTGFNLPAPGFASPPSAENIVFVTSQRKWKPSKSGLIPIIPIEDELPDDRFQKARTDYEHLQTVTSILDLALIEQIISLIRRYEQHTGKPLPLAWRKPISDLQAITLPARWKTNKPERLEAALWVFEHLDATHNPKDAINQLAGVLAQIETVNHFAKLPPGAFPDPTPLRLTQPVPETIQGVPIQVSYGIRHVTLFNRQGAVQIQHLPQHLQKLNYRQRSQLNGVVVLNKPDAMGRDFWEPSIIK